MFFRSKRDIYGPASAYAVTNVETIKAQYSIKPTTSISYASLPAGVQERLNIANQNQVASLTELKAKLSKLHSDNPLVVAQIEKLTKAIAKKSKNAKAFALTEKNEFSALEMQVVDAYVMLMDVEKAAVNTLSILQRLSHLSNEALNGTLSDADRKIIDLEFQANIQAIDYIQSIHLYNGTKKISGGNVTLQFGNQAGELSTLTIDLPAFDMVGMGLKGDNVRTTSNAGNAFVDLAGAITTVVDALGKMKRLQDAEAMLIMIPSMLNESFDVLKDMTSLALRASNGTYSDVPDREILNDSFDDYKGAMNKAQTYISLQGPKMIGKGNLHIQIGNVNSPETTLDIPLPAADVKASGVDNLDVKTVASATHSMDAILGVMRDFIYPAKS
ncbi:MAG: hypothetical protein WAW86_08885 [Gammaproteobacteria bacterium]